MENTVIIAALNHQELKQWMARLREEAIPFERHSELELVIERKFLYLFPELEETKPPPSKKEKRNRIDRVLRIIVLVFAAIGIGAFALNYEAPIKSSQEKPYKSDQEMIDAQFSAWDGSHAKLVKLVKKSMKDPSSFQHVETRHKKMDDHLVIWMDYRGKNSFGAYDLATVKAAYDYDGNFLWIENVR